MKQVLFALLLIDLIIVVLVYFIKGEGWLINSQIAFVSSSLVMLASMFSYRGMVTKRLDAGAIPDDERDTLDKLEDPYDLYDEKTEVVAEEKSLKEVVIEERKNLKKSRRSIWETTKDAKASFSFYRLFAYIVLVLGFFYLNSNKLLELLPYLIFLSFPPIVIVFILMQNRE